MAYLWLVAVCAALVVGVAACGDSAGPSSAIFEGEAVKTACPEAQLLTRCFEVTARNVGRVAGDGACWVAAIANHRREIAKSTRIEFTDAAPGDSRVEVVMLTMPRRPETLGFPVHCDPTREG
jgi:hypothetical protein